MQTHQFTLVDHGRDDIFRPPDRVPPFMSCQLDVFRRRLRSNVHLGERWERCEGGLSVREGGGGGEEAAQEQASERARSQNGRGQEGGRNVVGGGRVEVSSGLFCGGGELRCESSEWQERERRSVASEAQESFAGLTVNYCRSSD